MSVQPASTCLTFTDGSRYRACLLAVSSCQRSYSKGEAPVGVGIWLFWTLLRQSLMLDLSRSRASRTGEDGCCFR